MTQGADPAPTARLPESGDAAAYSMNRRGQERCPRADGCPRAAGYRRVLKATGAVVGTALAATAMTNALIAMRSPRLGNRLGGAFSRYPSRYGDLAYTVGGSGPPLLLLHGLGAGNSMAEWSQNFDALCAAHTVYAFDFLGWGLSDKPAQRHTAEDCIEQVQYFVEDVIARPTAVIASSHSCAFAIEAAQRAPDLFEQLVLVCPASGPDENPVPQISEKLVRYALRLPLVGVTLRNFLASRRAIREFARRHLYFDKRLVDESLVTRYHTAAHQPGTQYALLSFLAGLLSADARESWSRLAQPALLVWGRHAMLDGLDTAPEWLALKPDAQLEVIDRAMLLPHAEQPRDFNELVIRWLSRR
jgi:pimeloyl-ACP methyl ester carboxylesterase